ncbi:MAG TPA: menaquinol oxidoreductase, partial [Syntrophobacteraceae bacterium]|nr:menaquinol oxidoreductase [Syntrophobacteraceae bacterium]
VRNGMREYKAPNGKVYNMSLQNECLRCHSNKAQFCDQCHNYMAVAPYCFTCHVEPLQKEKM